MDGYKIRGCWFTISVCFSPLSRPVMDRFRDAVNQAAALAPGAAGGTEQEAVKAANRATR